MLKAIFVYIRGGKRNYKSKKKLVFIYISRISTETMYYGVDIYFQIYEKITRFKLINYN